MGLASMAMAEPYTYRVGKGSILLGLLMLISSPATFLFLIVESAEPLKNSFPFSGIFFLFPFFLALRFVLRTTVSIRVHEDGVTQTTCLKKRMVRWEDILTVYVRVPVNDRQKRWDAFFKHSQGWFSIGDWAVGARNSSLVQAIGTHWNRPTIVEHLYPRDVIETPMVRYKRHRRLLVIAGLLSCVVLAALKILGLSPSVTWTQVAIEPTVWVLYFLVLALGLREAALMEIRHRSAKSIHWPQTLASRLRVPLREEMKAGIMSLFSWRSLRLVGIAVGTYYGLVVAIWLVWPYPYISAFGWAGLFLFVPQCLGLLGIFVMLFACLQGYLDARNFRRKHTRKKKAPEDRR